MVFRTLLRGTKMKKKKQERPSLTSARRKGTPRSAIIYTTKLKLNNGYAKLKHVIENSVHVA
jgi:hypothetical protein